MDSASTTFGGVFTTQPVKGCKYICGGLDCGKITEIKQRDAIKCRSCGCSVLYKMRTTAVQQYTAR